MDGAREALPTERVARGMGAPVTGLIVGVPA